MNKNIFAFALCFATFTAQADNFVDTTKTTTIVINDNGELKSMVAVVITREQALEILSPSFTAEELNNLKLVDGIAFNYNEVMYVVITDDSVTTHTSMNSAAKSDDSVESKTSSSQE